MLLHLHPLVRDIVCFSGQRCLLLWEMSAQFVGSLCPSTQGHALGMLEASGMSW